MLSEKEYERKNKISNVRLEFSIDLINISCLLLCEFLWIPVELKHDTIYITDKDYASDNLFRSFECTFRNLNSGEHCMIDVESISQAI